MSDETGRGRGATTTIEEIREILADTAREGRRIQQEAEKRQAEHEAAAKKRQADFEKWRAENEAAAKKRHAENEAAAKKRQADLEEWQEENKEWRVECEERVRYLDSIFTSNWGALIESLVAGDLVKLLRKRRINVTGIQPNSKRMFNGRMHEIDIVAINGEDAVVVEVKTTLRVNDVKKFLEFLPLFRRIFSEYSRKRIRGAVAYLKSHEESHVYAQRKGLFVIRATGSSASIINPKKFKAQEF